MQQRTQTPTNGGARVYFVTGNWPEYSTFQDYLVALEGDENYPRLDIALSTMSKSSEPRTATAKLPKSQKSKSHLSPVMSL